MKNFLKKISYHPLIIRLVKFLHLRPIFRKLYFYLVKPADGIFRVQIGKINAQFYVSKPEELRSLESDKEGEGRVAELLIPHLKSGDIVYDIGANIGFYTVILGKAVGKKGRLIAFEPEKESYVRLQNNLKLNELTNVYMFQKAIGDKTSEAKLYLGQTTGNFSLVKTYEKEIGSQIVEIVNGDQFIKERNLPIPKLVKIDVEGYEYSVLQGLSNTLSHPNCEIICCEIHPRLLLSGITGERILELIKSFGFKKFDIYKRTNDYHLIAYKNKKLKVLVSAYTCLFESGGRVSGGEAILGWNIVKQISRFHRVFVLTHSENRGGIEAVLKKKPLPNTKFYYLNLPGWLDFLQKFSGGVQIYSYLWQIKAYFFAKKLHSHFHFDVFHHVTYANDWMASFIGALLKIPYIRGPGGGAHKVPKNFLPEFSLINRLSQYLRSIGQWLFRHDPFFIISQQRARAILVCNQESLEAIPKKWQNKTYLFPVNGVSTADLNLLKLKKEENSGNEFRILSAGKLIPIKGFNLAIKAFKTFLDKVSNAKFKIIGDGPELPRLKNLVFKLRIQEKIQFKKWMHRDEFLKELTLCDVFLFSSLRDGGGAVVVEAMAAGKPVICLDIGGPGFYITSEWGIKIKPNFPDQAIQEMAEALGKLYFNKELRNQLGKAARERTEKEYHWDRLGEKLFKIYGEVLKI